MSAPPIAPPPRAATLRGITMAVLWCALLAGILEVGLLFRERFILGRDIGIPHEFAWMTPAADVIVFFAIAALLVPLLRATTAIGPVAAAFGAGMALAALSVLTHFPKLAWWADVVLAVGIGTQAGRLFAAHADRARRLVALTLPVLAVTAAAAGIAWHLRLAGKSAEERRHLAGSARAGAPNVLLIVWDAVRADDLGLYGYARPTTPRLDVFAARGATFDRMLSTASYTLPGHTSLFTGKWPHQVTSTWNIGLSRDTPTLAEVLSLHGYRTGAFSANHTYVSWEHGLLRGFATAEDFEPSFANLVRPSGLVRWAWGFKKVRGALGLYDLLGRRDAANIREHFLAWQAAGPRDQPFFAFMNMFDAHDPYLPDAPFDRVFAPASSDDRERNVVRRQAMNSLYDMTPAQRLRQRDMYDGAIAQMDDNVGRILDELGRRGVLDNTLVVITADHGEAFGEHGQYAHGNDIHWEEIHVPCVMVLPGRVPAGVRLTGIASLRDVATTIADIVGITGRGSLPGRSLADHWRAGGPALATNDTVLVSIRRLVRGAPPDAPVMQGHNRSIIAWPYRLITVGSRAELYDLSTDPGEHLDLAHDTAHAGRLDSLAAAMARWRLDAIPAKR